VNRRFLLERLRRGHCENVDFADFCRLVEAFGFRRQRTRGSHSSFRHPRVPQLLILQPQRGKAKAYQVRQFLQFVERYNLTMEAER
jgi:predicted RNA binding protein YcfA (HicA-like mRNA interferase family)